MVIPRSPRRIVACGALGLALGLPTLPVATAPGSPNDPPVFQSKASVIKAQPVMSDTGEPSPASLHDAIRSANPDYAGGARFRYADGRLHSFSLMKAQQVADLSPVGEMDIGTLKVLVLYNSRKIKSLAPFARCEELKQLNVERCYGLTSLEPMRALPLEWVRMYACPGIKSLAPLKDAPLAHLDLGKCEGITDLSLLAGMPMRDLRIDDNPQITDISVVEQMPELEVLSVFNCKGIEDYRPLHGLKKLHTLLVSPELLDEADLQAIREMQGLKILAMNWTEWHQKQTPEQFWAKLEADD